MLRENKRTHESIYGLGVGCCIYLFSKVFLGPISRNRVPSAPFFFMQGKGRTLTDSPLNLDSFTLCILSNEKSKFHRTTQIINKDLYMYI